LHCTAGEYRNASGSRTVRREGDDRLFAGKSFGFVSPQKGTVHEAWTPESADNSPATPEKQSSGAEKQTF
jgi:hypothetical protein